MTIFIFFILGLVIGSFLNAVIYRLHSGESVIFSRSHCPKCGHELSAWDLIPVVSFIILKRSCRYCHAKISWQYPIVELITGITFVLFAINYGLRITDYGFLFNLVLACVFIVIAVYDFKHYLILDKVIFPALALVTLYNLFNAQFINGLEGALLVSGFFALQYFLSHGRWIGFGDVKFGLLLGSLFGLNLSLVFLFLAYMMGGVLGLILLTFAGKQLGSKLPFGVFLSASAIIMMLYGMPLTAWYFKLLGI